MSRGACPHLSRGDHEKPESRATTVSMEVVGGALGLLVVVIAILIATGKVPVFPGG